MNIGQIKPNLLYSMRDQPLRWSVALGELCDNSFDAGANRIAITFGPKKLLTVQDDGAGCDDIERMLTLGDHYRQRTTKLGRFGVGLKEAACWLWGELRIETTSKSTCRKACIDWERVAKQEDWDVPDPTVTQGVEAGTRLAFRNVARGFPDFGGLRAELGYTFAPALWSGKQIVLEFTRRKPATCSAWRMPDLEDVIQDRFEVNGKRVRLEAGIVALGAMNEKKGFSFAHGHRIICNSGLGSCGRSVARLCGIVQLDRQWTLSKNKTEVVDCDEEGLAEAIYERCQGILAKAEQQAHILRNSELEGRVTESLRVILGNQRKEKRSSPENGTGRVNPVDTGRKRKHASKKQPGNSIFGKCDVGQMRMEWEESSHPDMGRVDLPGNVVYLNSRHPRLAYHKENENTDAIVDHCMTLIAFAAVEAREDGKFPWARNHDTFVGALSHVLQSQQQTDAEQQFASHAVA